MRRPRLEACYFASTVPDDPFERMAIVLRATAAKHCAAWDRRIERTTPIPRASSIGFLPHVHNAQKIEQWASIIAEAPDGDRVLLVDADTAILRPLDDAWDRSFDVAYTVKKRPFPYNLGVMFVRVSDPVRQFFAEWRDENLRMLDEREGQEHWRQSHGGINQASFGRLLERGAMASLQLERLPCAEWNCEESGWPRYDPKVTRILHIKGGLRRALFKRWIQTIETAPLVKVWRQLEQQANEEVTNDQTERSPEQRGVAAGPDRSGDAIAGRAW